MHACWIPILISPFCGRIFAVLPATCKAQLMSANLTQTNRRSRACFFLAVAANLNLSPRLRELPSPAVHPSQCVKVAGGVGGNPLPAASGLASTR